MAKYKKFKSFCDLFERCEAGDETAQRICIGALENLGGELLAKDHSPAPWKKERPKWRHYYDGLQRYIEALVGEYGIPDAKAERDTLAEVNFVIDCCDDVKLD